MGQQPRPTTASIDAATDRSWTRLSSSRTSGGSSRCCRAPDGCGPASNIRRAWRSTPCARPCSRGCWRGWRAPTRSARPRWRCSTTPKRPGPPTLTTWPGGICTPPRMSRSPPTRPQRCPDTRVTAAWAGRGVRGACLAGGRLRPRHRQAGDAAAGARLPSAGPPQHGAVHGDRAGGAVHPIGAPAGRGRDDDRPHRVVAGIRPDSGAGRPAEQRARLVARTWERGKARPASPLLEGAERGHIWGWVRRWCMRAWRWYASAGSNSTRPRPSPLLDELAVRPRPD